MRDETKHTDAATGSTAAPCGAVIGERISCRDAKRRVWQALDLLQSCHAKPQTVATPKADLSRDRHQRVA